MTHVQWSPFTVTDRHHNGRSTEKWMYLLLHFILKSFLFLIYKAAQYI